jgi:hypothetical protein
VIRAAAADEDVAVHAVILASPGLSVFGAATIPS